MAKNNTQSTVHYTSPVILSRFDGRRHTAYKELCQHSEETCARALNELAALESVSDHAFMSLCGGSYTSSIYPDGDVDRLKLISDLFSAGVLVDDLLDDATDMFVVSDLISKYRTAVEGRPVSDEMYELIVKFHSVACWDKDALKIVQAETNRYLDGTVILREIESGRLEVSVEKYFEARATNAYMGLEFAMIGFAIPELTRELVRVCAMAPEVFRRAAILSGKSIGIVLDLYKTSGKHPETVQYTNIVHVLRRASPIPLTIPEAMDVSVRMFHDFEAQLAAALEIGRAHV